MKRKVIFSLLALFLFSVTGALTATIYIRNTTATLSKLIQLHQIESFRQQLIISIQTVQSELYTIGTSFGHDINIVADNVLSLREAATRCGECHQYHSPDVITRIGLIQTDIRQYEDALSRYLTASANSQRFPRLKLEAAEIGNRMLSRTESMSRESAAKLSLTTASVMNKINKVHIILYVTIIATFGFGAVVAVHLTKSVTRPIETLVQATRAIADGDLSHKIILDPKDNKTEFGELASHFNAMSDALKENYEELQQEIKERREAEEALRESEERYALAARGANDGLWDWDIRHNRVHYSYRWKSMLGYEDEEIGDTLNEWLFRVHPIDREQLEARLTAHINNQQPHFECEFRIQHKNGTYMWVLSRGLAVRDESGRATRMAGSQTDITSRKTAEEQLQYDAFHDALTGLPNRALFMDRLEHAIAGSRRHASLFAVLFLDLDRFKVINDSLGHSVGDGLLVEVGRRIKSCVRPGDTVARLGGDEFAVLLEQMVQPDDAEEITRRIETSLSAPYQIQGHEIVTTQSIGIAISSERYEWPEQIIRDADIAMYEAKAGGKARHEFFDSTMHANIIDRLQLEADLRLAIEHKEGFVLHYQPIMDIKTHSLTGFEALVRWHHKSRGIIYPLDFIPLAEETGLIGPLSELIIHEACRQLRFWQTKYPANPPLRVSVNISSRILLRPGFADSITAVLKEENLQPGSLAIEVTESAIMEHTSAALETMAQLQAMGVHIHIDDFGTGYSSLSYLHSFPVNALKIDRSFISKMTTNENQEIVKTIITLAQNLKLEVIAEGVEEEHQLSIIKDLACQYGQGFLFSHPLSVKEMDAWIASFRRKH